MLAAVGPSRFVLFLCGQLGLNTIVRFFYQWIVDFTERGDPTALDPANAAAFTAAAAGVVILGFRIFDAISDPIAGTVSDRWVQRGHERRSLLWFSLLVPAVGLALVFAPTPEMAVGLRWALLCAGLLLFYVGYTFYAIPYWSLVDDYSQGDEDTRRGLSNMLGVGLLLASAVISLVSPGVVESRGYLTAALIFGIPCAALMVLPYYARPPGALRAATGVSAAGDSSLFSGFADAFRHKRFIATLAVFSGAQMAFTIMTSAAPFIATDLLGGTRGDVPMLLGPFLLTSLLSMSVVPRVTKRYGIVRVISSSAIALALVYTGTATLGMSIVGSPLITAAILFALGGPMAAIFLSLEAEAVAACAAECDEQVTSVYFGVFNFVVKGFNALAMFTTSVLATLSSGELGVLAVRSMGLSAGGVLVLGTLGYYMLPPVLARLRPGMR